MFQRITDEPLAVCEVCGGRLRKVFHPAGILFKGSGFYKTDSRAPAASGNGKKEARASRESAKPGAESSGSADKSDGNESKSASKETSG